MPNTVRFDCFEADLDSGQLRKHGIRVRLRDQAFQVLASLLQHPGRIATREELRRLLWHHDIFVDFDNNLNIVIARLREALGDSADHPRFIETIPKRGYRFVAQVLPAAMEEIAAPMPRAKLVVLPFVSLSTDNAQEVLGDAITDEITTELAAFAPSRLGVIARTTAMFYKHSRKSVTEIGRNLGANYLVEGSVRRIEDVVTVNVQLIQTLDQTHLFARKYDSSLKDIFSIQRRIAAEIAEHIPEATESQRAGSFAAPRRSSRSTFDLAAYNEYVQGRYQFAKGTAESASAARRHFERAIASDPDFALAHDALAETHWYLGYTGFMSSRQAYSAGIIHALRAIELDGTRAETHALLGEFHKTLDYNWPEVRREMSIALRLEPRSPLVCMRYAVSELMPHGRLDEAIVQLRRALELDPLSFLGRMWMGILLILARRYSEAIEEGRKLIEFDPTYYLAYFLLACSYRYLGHCEEALLAQRKAVELSGGAAYMLGWLGLTLGSGNDPAAARAILRQLHQMAASGYVPPTSFAWVHLGLGEVDDAFQWLNRAVDECDQLLMPIKSYAFFDPLRCDPRFHALLRGMHLEC